MTAEERTLLAALGWLMDRRPVELPEPLDWERLYQLAVAHKLIPILEAALPAAVLPAAIAAQIQAESRRRRMRLAVMAADFQTLARRFLQAGIPLMPLKGIYLAHAIYPSPAWRYFDDLDLLVPGDAGPAALDVLKAAGFRPHPRAPKPDWHHLPPYAHQEHHTTVEIHTDLVRRARPGWDIAAMWARARPGQLDGVDCHLMANEDALIYAALHARHNLYNRLSFFLDAALLARKVDSSAAPVEGLAAAAGARQALAYTLETAARLLGIELPSPVKMGPFGRWAARQVAAWESLRPARQALQVGSLPRLVELALLDSPADALRLAGRLLAPPKAFVEQGYRGRSGRRLWQRARLAAGQVARAVREK